MTAPASGLWGPGDFGPDFVTIDQMCADDAWDGPYGIILVERSAIRDAILDLAEDLDARGLVLVDLADLRAMQREAWNKGVAFGVDLPPVHTADADAVTASPKPSLDAGS